MTDFRTTIKKIIPKGIFKKIEPLGHLIEAFMANVRFGFPARGIRVIGVTGTNGKTTTTYLIQTMLAEAGYKVGMLSTVGYGVGDEIKPQIEHITTAQSGILFRRVRDFRKQGIEWLVVEASSHALAQYRTWGLKYEVAVMTNVTHEHLDYHGTFHNYLEAKRRLFKLADKNVLRFGVVNAEDPNADKFVATIKNHTTYGLSEGDITASDIKLRVDHSTFNARIDDDIYKIKINIPGEFNVSNSLATIAVGRKLGLTIDQIEQGIAKLQGIEGRMMMIDEGQQFKVMIDFAGTPDAFDKFFATIRPATKGLLVVVFGSPSQRDEAKRPVQGKIAGENSDIVVVTEEDDRVEPSEKILGEIAAGAIEAGMEVGKNLFLIENREDAIKFALSKASAPEDLVVMLGKGHEKTIERADGVHSWDETGVTRSALREMVKNQSHKKDKS